MTSITESITLPRQSFYTHRRRSRLYSWARFRSLLLVGSILSLSTILVVYVSVVYFMPLSLRLDESQSVWQAGHSINGLLRTVAKDVHVPLYHLLLHNWMVFFGTSEFAVRSLSLVFFTASFTVFYLLARTLLRRNWALVAVLLYALNPFSLWYGTEARMYAMLLFVTLVNQLFFIRIIQRKGGWLGYSISAVFGIYTHYFFWFGLAAQAIYVLLSRKHVPARHMRHFVGVAMALFIALLPWFLYFRSLGSAGETSPMLPKPTTIDFFNVYSQFFFGFQNDTINTIILSAWPLLVLSAFWIIRRNIRDNPLLHYFLAAAFLPALLAYGASLVIRPFFLSRYMIALLPSLIILIIWLLQHYQRRIGATLLALCVGIFSLSSARTIASPNTPVKEDYRSAARYLQRTASARDAIVVSAPFTIYPFQYYYQGHATVTTVPIWNRLDAMPAFDATKLPENIASLRANRNYLHVLTSHDQGYEKQLIEYLDMNLEKTDTQQFSEGLTLRTYRVGYYDVPLLGTFEELNF